MPSTGAEIALNAVRVNLKDSKCKILIFNELQHWHAILTEVKML